MARNDHSLLRLLLHCLCFGNLGLLGCCHRLGFRCHLLRALHSSWLLLLLDRSLSLLLLLRLLLLLWNLLLLLLGLLPLLLVCLVLDSNGLQLSCRSRNTCIFLTYSPLCANCAHIPLHSRGPRIQGRMQDGVSG